VKVNYDFYKGQDLYSDGDIENEIIEYEKKYKDMDEVFKKDIRWPVFYHLTPIRKNILNWYPFKENANVLEIGAGMGAITEVLCEKCKNVVCVELSKNRANSIIERNKDKENLEIIVANLNDVDFKERKFDYITLIGVFEYAALYTNTENPYIDFLNNIKKLLKPDGKLLIAIENKFGMKYWLGAPEDHTNIVYDGITGYRNKNYVQTFGKQEIKKILDEAEFTNTKFYYPLPDYKLPSLIFSDDYLPNEKTIENYTPYYYENTQVEFDEIKAYKEIIKNNMFDFFANSFLIEASQKPIETNVDMENIKLIPISDVSKKFYDKDYSKKDYNTELENLKQENLQLKQTISNIENSKSWKLTKIFRKINELIKRG
jgi:SAM-dependent methyltransferase